MSTCIKYKKNVMNHDVGILINITTIKKYLYI